ncbi:putative glycosyltransferase family 8 protein [Favolaschia claudopus]|uniref:glycogenin glucosyltransferase n=1 Tax=Favolaschia claudopus TaxID=2862362 RepID=A0AAW0EIN3_9AGAR
MAESAQYAFVTLLTSDAYLPGALALAGALKDLHPTPAVSPEVHFQTVCLVTPESVDVAAIKQLRRAYDVVVGVEIIAQEDDKGLKLLGRLDLNTVLTKLHVFRLTQYSKIIFLDADVLPIRPLSHLFTLPHEFSAVPDVGWPDIFNSGVLVLSPGEDKFSQLDQLLKSKGTWDGGDQGILNEWRGGDWNRLSFTYNTTPTAAYTYAPAYERFGSQISAIHFIGPNKPWNSLTYRSPFQNHAAQSESGPLQAYDYPALVDRWFAVYDKHFRPETLVSETEFQVKRYVSAWDEQTGTGSELISGSMASGTAMGLEDLRKVAIQGMSAGGPPDSSRPKEGAYLSLPLEGRVDLMRPRRQVQEVAENAEEQQGGVGAGNATTPRPTIQVRDLPPARWDTLPTPGPNEVPPSPRLAPISLPSSPNPASFTLDQHAQPQPQPHSEHQQSLPPQQQQQSHPHQQHFEHQHPHSHQQQPSHQNQPQQHHEPPRPPSPPMLIWNPATDPPPTTQPSASAFPSETYFPNIWDQPQTRQHHAQGPRGLNTPPDSNALFQPPPPSEIPASLRRQGHYVQVTGEAESGNTASPDRSKVKHVFPWEEKPRHMPGRVFPASDAPSPSRFISPVATPPEEPVVAPETPSQLKSQPLSPLYGLPSTLTYANAWDSVPSIQRYASKLVRPPHSPPVALAPAFDDDRYRKRSWEDRTEVSSMDGDDEDESDEDDESLGETRRAGYESDRATSKSSKSSKSSTTVRSRGSSVSGSYSIKGKKTEYTVRGVQTISPKYRSQGTQTDSDVAKVSTNEKRSPQNGGRRQRPPSAMDLMSPVTVHAGPDLSMATAAPSPLQPGSPREFPYASTPTRAFAEMTTPPARPPVVPLVERPSSNSSLTSPPSSFGPVSPPDGPLAASPARKGSRVWDPARGVELFKRGSEEVLARFLKMGSWEEENAQ